MVMGPFSFSFKHRYADPNFPEQKETNLPRLKKLYTFIDLISAGVASETLYVTGCHPRLSRSLEAERSHALCVTDRRVSSSSKPVCCIAEELNGQGT